MASDHDTIYVYIERSKAVEIATYLCSCGLIPAFDSSKEDADTYLLRTVRRVIKCDYAKIVIYLQGWL